MLDPFGSVDPDSIGCPAPFAGTRGGTRMRLVYVELAQITTFDQIRIRGACTYRTGRQHASLRGRNEKEYLRRRWAQMGADGRRGTLTCRVTGLSYRWWRSDVATRRTDCRVLR